MRENEFCDAGPDRNARFIQATLQKLKYFDAPIAVVNLTELGLVKGR